MTFIDISDMLVFLRSHLAVSGIQRVIANIVEASAETGSPAVEWVRVNSNVNELEAVDGDRFRKVIQLLKLDNPSRPQVLDLLDQVESSIKPVQPKRGDVFVVLGAFWVVHNLPSVLARLKARGVRTCIFFHDLIPHDFPEFAPANQTFAFRDVADKVVRLIDFAITNSAYVARTTANFLQSREISGMPIRTVRLALERTQEVREPQLIDYRKKIHTILKQSFVLCVGSLEIRKNHAYLFQLWNSLLKKRGATAMPRLVLVGRRGWRVAELFEQLKSTDNLSGHIELIDDVTDVELAALYRGCLFTMFPSYAEGWGLPVGESLSYGKVCVASDTTSIPEVGGDLALYVDPLNVRDGERIVSELLFQPGRLEAASERVRREFRPRSWRQVSQELFAAIADLGAAEPRAFSPPRLRARAWLSAGQATSAGPAGTVSDASSAFVGGWHSPEAWGRWADSDRAEVVFDAAGASAVVIILVLHLPGFISSQHLTISQDGQVRFQGVLGSPVQSITIETSCGADGVVNLVLALGEVRSDATDPRPLSLGISRMFFYRSDTLEERMLGMQDLVLQSLSE